MSKSPLAGAFAEGPVPELKKRNKKGGAMLLIAGAAATFSVGGVFAANSITLNGDSAIEFGQGSGTTASCVDELTTSMTQDYVYNEGDHFYVGDVGVGGVFTGCAGATLTVDLRSSDGTSLHTFSFGVVSSGATGDQINSDATTFTKDLSAETIDASSVARITVTTGS